MPKGQLKPKTKLLLTSGFLVVLILRYLPDKANAKIGVKTTKELTLKDSVRYFF